jgi:type IV pilus assembly protein PilQ
MNVLRRAAPSLVLLSLVSVLRAAPPPPAAAPWLAQRVTVDVRQAPLSTFLDSISMQAKVNFILTEGTEQKKVTAFLHDVTVQDALDLVLASRGVAYRQLSRTNTVIVALKDSPAIVDPPVVTGGKELDQRVTVRVKNAPLDQFLDTVSAQTKANFVLGEGLDDVRITAFLENVTAREALEIVMTIKGLSCKRVEGRDAYMMSRTVPKT